MLLLQGPARVHPRHEPALERQHVREAELGERLGRRGGAAAAGTVEQHRALRFQAARRLLAHARQRNVHRSADPEQVPFVLLAHVDECDIVTARFHLDRGRSRHLSKSLPRILRAFDHLVPLSRYQCVWLTRRLSSATWRWPHAPPKVAYGLPRPQNRSLRFAW